MALLQQARKRRRILVTAIHQAFVERLQLMGQVANRANLGHPRAPLEGVQVTLQGRQRAGIVRLLQPAIESLGRAVENVEGFLKEDFDHFLVQLTHLADRWRTDRLGHIRLSYNRRGDFRHRLGFGFGFGQCEFGNWLRHFRCRDVD